uniref:S10_plectin domain-containing protein n=1 Tax=Heterorhabditis bacteriophora TaxID=37862 RepID=A0A1I7WK31_HETBA
MLQQHNLVNVILEHTPQYTKWYWKSTTAFMRIQYKMIGNPLYKTNEKGNGGYRIDQEGKRKG